MKNNLLDPTVLQVPFTPDYEECSGAMSEIGWEKPIVRQCLHNMFGKRPGEILTGVTVGDKGIKGHFRSGRSTHDSEATMERFVDDTRSFRHCILKFPLLMSVDTPGPLRDQAGKNVIFFARPKGKILKIKVKMPKGLELPDTEWSDLLLVKFTCTRASVHIGNVAESVVKFP
jgi:hypothetical protein